MKRLLMLLIALALLLAAMPVHAEAPETVPDFTVTTIDGETLSLYELLDEKDLVVLNIFTSWCPPCKSEFPMLEMVYEANADRMAVIAVSDEPADTPEILDDYRKALGLTFDIAQMEGTGIHGFVNIMGYPTFLFITRGGNVGYFQLGAFLLPQELEAVTERMLAEGYDNRRFVFYGVYCCDEDENPVEGVVVNFCTDTLCEPVTSDMDGEIIYLGEPEAYHVQVLKVPEGYRLEGDADIATGSDGGWMILQLKRDE